jgi:hypothetical protein
LLINTSLFRLTFRNTSVSMRLSADRSAFPVK